MFVCKKCGVVSSAEGDRCVVCDKLNYRLNTPENFEHNNNLKYIARAIHAATNPEVKIEHILP
jgi:hypothetical protein